eukprot:CAMPEP_0119405836 /NCGR_PEP_ID=MMETSP1335-20130426/390_1 /TAXON_ID=259385 /ORGANISM="Chrysoculter rhomboideus, Strain RCC1486" /LENGTH=109 /DNA_ID=CAMNT_0007429881 /DNA_START=486 /DNA_END=811 /DNA_ORIENTATION=+
MQSTKPSDWLMCAGVISLTESAKPPSAHRAAGHLTHGCSPGADSTSSPSTGFSMVAFQDAAMARAENVRASAVQKHTHAAMEPVTMFFVTAMPRRAGAIPPPAPKLTFA